MADTYRPTKGMQEEGQRALDWIAAGKAGDGFTDVGRKRAADLAAGRPLSADTVMRMFSFFARHEGDKRAVGWSPGEDGYPSPGRVAWAAWGGDPGFEFSARIREQLLAAARAVTDMEEPMEQRAVFGENAYGTGNYLQAADAAIDAAQTLLEQIKDTEPVAAQAYSLLVAADASLDPVLEALGLSDPDEDAVEGETVEESGTEERAKASDLGVGTWVSWQSKDGRSRGKVEKVATDGIMESSEGFQLKASADAPLYLVRVFAEQGGGWVPTDRTVVQPGSILTVTKSLPQPRAAEADEVEQRKTALAGAERLTFDAEVRTADSGEMRISGYAAKFNSESTGLSFREVIAPGAFTRSLASGEPVYLLVNHDAEQLPLASTGSGTMQLREDEVGLLMDAELDSANPRAVELYSALSRGDVSKMSFAFTVAPDGQKREGGLRTLTDLNLFECSVVTWPAYASTEVGARDADPADLDLRRRWLAARHAQLSI